MGQVACGDLCATGDNGIAQLVQALPLGWVQVWQQPLPQRNHIIVFTVPWATCETLNLCRIHGWQQTSEASPVDAIPGS